MLDAHFLLLKYSYFLFFPGFFNLGESEVKMHLCSTYGARENVHEFTV